jgi:uncharacterized damage-inducible protein DinB
MSTATQSSVTPEFAAGLRDVFLQTIASERDITKRVVAAVPSTKTDYKHDPKGRTALELATHVVESDVWFLNSIADGAFNFDPEKSLKPFKSAAEAVAWYEKNFQPAFDRVAKLPGEKLVQVVDFFGMKMPNYQYLMFAINHAVHHRGQLSTFLRPMGGKVPDIYGGSADEPWQQ